MRHILEKIIFLFIHLTCHHSRLLKNGELDDDIELFGEGPIGIRFNFRMNGTKNIQMRSSKNVGDLVQLLEKENFSSTSSNVRVLPTNRCSNEHECRYMSIIEYRLTKYYPYVFSMKLPPLLPTTSIILLNKLGKWRSWNINYDELQCSTKLQCFLHVFIRKEKIGQPEEISFDRIRDRKIRHRFNVIKFTIFSPENPQQFEKLYKKFLHHFTFSSKSSPSPILLSTKNEINQKFPSTTTSKPTTTTILERFISRDPIKILSDKFSKFLMPKLLGKATTTPIKTKTTIKHTTITLTTITTTTTTITTTITTTTTTTITATTTTTSSQRITKSEFNKILEKEIIIESNETNRPIARIISSATSNNGKKVKLTKISTSELDYDDQVAESLMDHVFDKTISTTSNPTQTDTSENSENNFNKTQIQKMIKLLNVKPSVSTTLSSISDNFQLSNKELELERYLARRRKLYFQKIGRKQNLTYMRPKFKPENFKTNNLPKITTTISVDDISISNLTESTTTFSSPSKLNQFYNNSSAFFAQMNQLTNKDLFNKINMSNSPQHQQIIQIFDNPWKVSFYFFCGLLFVLFCLFVYFVLTANAKDETYDVVPSTNIQIFKTVK
ncbi:hypothetical protein SNEBB_007103 [Seison nebaliae]|nr:hypothetical protein SNEBB_007103 [Seison nebaliae]